MTRINLDFVALHTADLDAARQYYTGVLGFGLAASSPSNATVFRSSGGASLAVRLPQPHEVQHPPSAQASVSGSVCRTRRSSISDLSKKARTY